MAMGQSVVRIEIAVPQRMMSPFGRLAARTGAAGHARNKKLWLDEPEREQGHAREEHRGRETTGMRDMRRSQRLQVLRHGARKLLESFRRAMLVLVDLFVHRGR